MFSSLWSARPRTCAGSGWLKLPSPGANPPPTYLELCWHCITHAASNLSPCWPWTTTTCCNGKKTGYRKVDTADFYWLNFCVNVQPGPSERRNLPDNLGLLIPLCAILASFHSWLHKSHCPPPQGLCCTRNLGWSISEARQPPCSMLLRSRCSHWSCRVCRAKSCEGYTNGTGRVMGWGLVGYRKWCEKVYFSERNR